MLSPFLLSKAPVRLSPICLHHRVGFPPPTNTTFSSFLSSDCSGDQLKTLLPPFLKGFSSSTRFSLLLFARARPPFDPSRRILQHRRFSFFFQGLLRYVTFPPLAPACPSRDKQGHVFFPSKKMVSALFFSHSSSTKAPPFRLMKSALFSFFFPPSDRRLPRPTRHKRLPPP